MAADRAGVHNSLVADHNNRVVVVQPCNPEVAAWEQAPNKSGANSGFEKIRRHVPIGQKSKTTQTPEGGQ